MRELDKKEKLLLYVLYFVGAVYGRTYIQKLFFLIEKELFRDTNFNFIKYHYGPFSRELNDMLSQLVTERFVIEKLNVTKGLNIGHNYRLSSTTKTLVENFINKEDKDKIEILKEFCEKYKNYTPSEILKLVYLKYPEWTINSLLNS